MENNNKKKDTFWSILASFFIPSKMGRHANLNFFISLLILICASFINISTSNLRASKDARNSFYYPKDIAGAAFDLVDNLNITLNDDNTISTSDSGVYHEVKQVNDHNVDLTVVVDASLDTKSGNTESPVALDIFDFEGYVKQQKADNTDYLLYIFTKDTFYYLYNLEKDDKGVNVKDSSKFYVFETEAGKKTYEYIYYLPLNESELVINSFGDLDTTKWTKKVTSDAKIDFTIENEELKSLSSQLVPSTRHQKNLNNALYGTSYSYVNLKGFDFDVTKINSDIDKFNLDLIETIVEIDASFLKTSTLILSCLITLIFPLLLTFITWALSKGFYLRKFRQYYALASLCFAVVALINVILGIFMNYLRYTFISLVIASLYYIIVTFKINSKGDPDKPSKKEEQVVEEKKSYMSEDTARIG